MDIFDLDHRWKLPESLTRYISLIQRLGRLRRLAEHHPIIHEEYQRLRSRKKWWEVV